MFKIERNFSLKGVSLRKNERWMSKMDRSEKWKNDNFKIILNEKRFKIVLTNKRLFFFLLDWTNDYTKRLFSGKTNKIDGKWTIILRTKEIIFLNDWKNERNGSFTNDERTKLGPSLIVTGCNPKKWDFIETTVQNLFHSWFPTAVC